MSLSFAELSVGDVEKSALTSYETIAKTTLYPGDPVRLFLESLAYVLALQNSIIDMAGKANLLQFASGEHLDAHRPYDRHPASWRLERVEHASIHAAGRA